VRILRPADGLTARALVTVPDSLCARTEEGDLTMLDQLSPAFRTRATTVIQKWEGFLAKVGARVDETVVEADVGLNEIIAAHTTDPGPLGAAFSALQARFRGLQNKVTEAWEKIDGELDAIRDDAEGQDLANMSKIWSQMSKSHRDWRHDIDLRYELLVIQKEADLARALYQQGEREKSTPVNCHHCGAPLKVDTWWESSNVACGACNAVNSVSPGPGIAYFYLGNGAHALVREMTRDSIVAHTHAERGYKALRIPTEEDFQRYMAVARAMYAAYYQTMAANNPAFRHDVNQQTEAKMLHYSHYDSIADKKARASNGKMLQLAIAGDRAGLAAHVKAEKLDLDECLYAAAERGAAGAIDLLLELQYAADGEGESKGPWLAEKKRELAHWTATRG